MFSFARLLILRSSAGLSAKPFLPGRFREAPKSLPDFATPRRLQKHFEDWWGTLVCRQGGVQTSPSGSLWAGTTCSQHFGNLLGNFYL